LHGQIIPEVLILPINQKNVLMLVSVSGAQADVNVLWDLQALHAKEVSKSMLITYIFN
jgi:hypothetical protein